jgi:putative hemolysin
LSDACLSYYFLDIDRFDCQFDHLVILEKATQRCLATYRLMCSTFSTNFYSSTEFDLGALRHSPGVKLEIGRACVAADFRSGIAIVLLWKGILSYAAKVGATLVFGCSSLPIVTAGEARMVLATLQQKGHIASEFKISVRKPYQFDVEEPSRFEGALPEVPPLLQSYLRAGAKVAGVAAYDRSFQCTDLLTLLDTQTMSPSFRKKLIAA